MQKDSPEKKKKMQTMRQLCLQRKNENFGCLKQWDQSRATKLTIHRKIIDQIDQNLQIKQSESNQYLKIVKHFFTDILNQKTKYISQAVDNPQKKIQLNSVGKNIYRKSSGFLGRMCRNTENVKQHKQIKLLLENSLDQLDNFIFESQKQLMEIRTQIEILVLEVQNCNMETLQKCDSVVSVFNSAKNLRAFQATTDFYLEQQQFLKAASDQLQTQRQLGCKMVEYLQIVQKRQKNKLEYLKTLIGKYIDCITEKKQQNSTSHLISLRQILNKNTEITYLEMYFSIDQLISKNIVFELARVHGKHQNQIDNKYLKNFLKKFEYDEFDDRNLILKSLNAFYRVQQEMQPIEIIITVDGFVNIYQNEYQTENLQHQVKKIVHSMKLSMSLGFKRIGDIQLELNVKKWGLITFGQNQEYTVNLIFANQDQRQQFCEFSMQLK